MREGLKNGEEVWPLEEQPNDESVGRVGNRSGRNLERRRSDMDRKGQEGSAEVSQNTWVCGGTR